MSVTAESLSAALDRRGLGQVGVAVSGGGDSVALLLLAVDWARASGARLAAATVDHGLRPEAGAEAAGVAALCARLGVPHETLRWKGWDGQGNLPDRARQARYDLLAGWAARTGLQAVLLGHTADDVAETLLMRLGRGSGVDGLAAMAPARRVGGVLFLRPLLSAARAELRDLLRARGVAWVEDPTNDDTGYDRVKARRALELLAPLGLTVEGLGATAGWMALAREVLEDAAARLAREAVRVEAGDLIIARASFESAPLETQLRLLSGALRWVAGGTYRPRADSLTAVYAELLSGRRQTLGGCLISPRRDSLRVAREPEAVAELVVPGGALWDRWAVLGPFEPGDQVRALGDLPVPRPAGVPRATLAASPAVWRGGEMIAAPLAGIGENWLAQLVADDFAASLTPDRGA